MKSENFLSILNDRCSMLNVQYSGPSSGYHMIAEFATPLVQVDLFEHVPVSFHKDSPALRAIGIAALVARHIPQVDIMDSFRQGHVSQFL
jgi:hypothetical protein